MAKGNNPSKSVSSGTSTGMNLSGTQTQQTSSITATETSSTQEVIPYIGAVTMAFKATGLRPNTIVYPYLDGLLWTQYTAPGLPNSSVTDTSDHNIVYSVSSPGSQLKTNANGSIWGKFTIPSGVVPTGQVKFGVVDANGAYIDEAKLQAAELGYTGDATTYAHGMFTADRILIRNNRLLLNNIAGFPSATSAGGAAGAAGAGAGACFIASVLISMADGTTKKISEVAIGDRVYNRDKTAVNTVTLLEYSTGEFDLYSPVTKIKPFATVDHPLYIDGDFYSVSPEDTFNVYPWLGKTQKLSPVKVTKSKGIIVYNLWTDGDSTYIVNGYGTTTIIGDGGLMKNAYHLNVITHEQVMAMMSYFFKEGNGRELSYGSYLVNKYVGMLNINFVTRILTNILINGKHNSPGKPLTVANKIVHFIGRKIGSIAWSFKNTK